MRSTKEIHDRLSRNLKEVKRVNSILIESPQKANEPFEYSNGTINEETNFDEEMAVLISEKRTLEWVLGIK